MLVSRKLLNRYVDIEDISTEKLANDLTEAGLEVEGIERLLDINNLVVGKVLTCERHKNSDHLYICTVDVGEEVLPIVCGAANVAKDQTVIVAKSGAILPGNFEIKEATIRGEESKGMICSLKELKIEELLDDDSDGIYVFNEEMKPGLDARQALNLEDEIMDVKQTPNRSDFMSYLAVAYEVAAIYDRELRLPKLEMEELEEADTDLELSLNTEYAHHFFAKIVNHVEIKESPKWIQEALISSGMKPINNLVDISNLVMLETGQPIHFYDKRFIEPLKISVEDEFEGEVKALDGHKYSVKKGDLLIMNDKKPIGIAGVMGLENSMILEDTKEIIIEVASFDRMQVRRTAQRLGLQTESAIRFSKVMDPLAPKKALNRAVNLLLSYANASNFEQTVEAGKIDYQPVSIDITSNEINRLLGTKIPEEEILDVFKRLHFQPKKSQDLIRTYIPSFRQDLSIKEDLIEEVIRIVGYDRLPESLPKLDLTLGTLSVEQKIIRDLESHLMSHGAHQIVTYTMVSKEKTNNNLSQGNAIKLMSPLSEQRAYIRTALLPSMIEVVRYNLARKNENLFLFEHSKIYTQNQTENRLAIVASGASHANTWKKDSKQYDFFSLKAVLLDVLDRLGFQEQRFKFSPLENEMEIFHPYQTAMIRFDGKLIGYCGRLHPQYESQEDLKETFYCEISLEPLLSAKRSKVRAKKLSKKHSIERDIAILVDESIPSDKIMHSIHQASKRQIEEMYIFDIFKSKELKNQKSLAFKLYFDGDKLESSEQVQKIMEKIEQQLVKDHNAIIR